MILPSDGGAANGAFWPSAIGAVGHRGAVTGQVALPQPVMQGLGKGAIVIVD